MKHFFAQPLIPARNFLLRRLARVPDFESAQEREGQIRFPLGLFLP
jgi:hypothetical protein